MTYPCLHSGSICATRRRGLSWAKNLRKPPPLNKKLKKVAEQANRLAALLSDEDVFCFLQDNLPPEMQLQCAPDNEGKEGCWHVHAFASVIADVALQRQTSPDECS